MYTTRDFPTKKALREAVKAGERVTLFQPGPFPAPAGWENSEVSVEGPHYPKPHTWYARVTLKDGVAIKVK